MLKHLGAVGLARGLHTVSQAVLLIFLARDVGPHEFGIIASFLAAHTVVFWLASMNTPTFVTREIALGQPARAFASIRINTMVMAASVALALLSTALLAGQPLLLVAVAGNAVAIWSERVTENRLAISYGAKRIRTPAVTLVIRALLPLCIYLGLTSLGVDVLLAFAIARVCAGLASQLLALLLIRIPRLPELPSVREILHAQAPLATSQSMGAIRMLDSVIVIGIAGAAVSGIYSAVSRVVAPFNTFAISAAPVLVPRAAVANFAQVRRILDGLFLAGLAVSAMTLLLTPFSEPLVVFVFGPQFASGGTVLLWVLLRVGPVAAAPLMSNALQAKGFDRLAAINSAATSVLTIAAVALGTIAGGASGAAAGFAVMSLLGMAALWLSGRRSLADIPEKQAEPL